MIDLALLLASVTALLTAGWFARLAWERWDDHRLRTSLGLVALRRAFDTGVDGERLLHLVRPLHDWAEAGEL